MALENELWYKVVTKKGEHSCCWVFAPRKKLFIRKTALMRVYRDGMIVSAARKTVGLFIFKNYFQAADFCEQDQDWKIKIVRPLIKPEIVNPLFCLPLGVLARCCTAADAYRFSMKPDTFNYHAPSGTYTCRKLEVISDLNEFWK